MSGLTLPPLSLYIHVPWCVRKCPYCDFNSHAVRSDIPEQAYIDRLIQDLELETASVQGRELHSIFIGGGTPSLLTAQAMDDLLNRVDRLLPFQSDLEITMEANPGTFEQERFAGFKAAGVNRLSIGVQSFNPKHLQTLGRIHSPSEAIKAAKAARQLGFERMNLDLMHGLPDQTPDESMNDLKQAIELNPDHLSWYQLTIEPNTEFFSKPPALPQEEALWEIQQQGQEHLAAAGFTQYEISAYAKSHQSRARHNINYWQFGDYIGIGAGAHGKITFPEDDKIVRRWKQRSPKQYLNAINIVGGESVIEREDRGFEFMMNALRLIDGVERSRLTERTGLSESEIQTAVERATQSGLLSTGDRFAATEKGQLFLNDLIEIFL